MNVSKEASLCEAFKYIEKSLQAKLESAHFPDHPTAKGDISENVWREVLRFYLPSRYSVESGFIIDAKNKISEQIDCIIYDNVFTPTFWGEYGYLYIPAEAVHAVFEIKQKVTKNNLQHASKKIEGVRVLYRTSASYMASGKEENPKPLFPIIGGLLATKMGYEKGLEAPQFSKSIYEIQKEDPKNKGIDIILTASDGYADYFDRGFPSDNPHKDKAVGAVARGLFRLVEALLAQGTVAAIDMKCYRENAFIEQKTD